MNNSHLLAYVKDLENRKNLDKVRDISASNNLEALLFENGIGRLITVKEMAMLLACSEKTIRDWVLKGLVPVTRPRPRMVRFDLQDILKWLAEKKG